MPTLFQQSVYNALKKIPKSNSEELTGSDEIKSQFGETDRFAKDSLEMKDEVEELKRLNALKEKQKRQQELDAKRMAADEAKRIKEKTFKKRKR